MQNVRIRWTMAGIVLISGQLTAFVQAGGQPPVSLLLKLSRTQILCYEPLPATLNLSCNSKNSVIYDRNAPIKTRFLSEVPHGEWAALTRCHRGALSDPFEAELRPGEPGIWDDLLFWRPPEDYGGEPFCFAKPGTYRIKACVPRLWIDGSRYDIESNVVDLEVRTPTGEDAEAAKIVTQRDVALYLYLGRTFYSMNEGVLTAPPSLDERLQERARAIAQVLDALRQLVAKYPRCVYADFARFALGRYSFRAYDRVPETFELRNPPDPKYLQVAFEHYAAISEHNPFLKQRAAYEQYRMLRRPGSPSSVDWRTTKNALSKALRNEKYIPELYYRALPELRGLELLVLPMDRRLNRAISFQPAESLTVGEVLRKVTLETAIPLGTDAVEEERLWRAPAREKPSMLSLMIELSAEDGSRYWERRGEGYFLHTISPVLNGSDCGIGELRPSR